MVSTRHQSYTSPAAPPINQRMRIETKPCICCTEDLPTTSFPKRTPTKLCQHKIAICNPCLNTWITTSIASQFRPSLRCPYSTCTEEICPRTDLKPGGTHQVPVWEVSNRIFHDKNPDWRWCLSPSCDSGQRHVPPKPAAPDWPPPSNLFTCGKCRVVSCATCEVLWHEGMTYEEYAKGNLRRFVEVAVDGKVIERLKEDGKVKECPNCGCSIEVEGSGGRMKCSRCLYCFETRGG